MGVTANLHLTCTNHAIKDICAALAQAEQQHGITTFVAPQAEESEDSYRPNDRRDYPYP